MKILLIVVYASMLPGKSEPEMKIYEQPTMQACNDNALMMMKRAKAGKLIAFCWRLK